MGYVSAKSLKDAGSSVYVEIFIDGVDYTSGTTTTLTTSEPLPAANAVWVYFDGVVQHHSEYGVSGYSVIFTSAIPTDTANVEVQFNKNVNVGIPGQNTITHSMMTSDNISTLLRKNAIINGNFDIWQRGASQTSSGYGSDDRWANQNAGSTKTASQQTFTLGQTDVPGNSKYYSRTVVTSSAGAANFVIKRQRIEGVRTFAGENVTLSFWAKADASKNIAIEFRQVFGTGGSPSASVTGIGSQQVSLTTSWQKYSVTVAVPSISGKTLGTGNDDVLDLTFWFDAGTNYDSRTASLGQQSGTFDLAQVQLEGGSTATDFEKRTHGQEQLLCQRYYQTKYFPTFFAIGFGRGTGSTTARTHIYELAIPMRTAPTGNTSTSGDIAVNRVSTDTDVSSTQNVAIIGNTYNTWYANVTVTIPAANASYRIHTTATAFTATFDAEL